MSPILVPRPDFSARGQGCDPDALGDAGKRQDRGRESAAVSFRPLCLFLCRIGQLLVRGVEGSEGERWKEVIERSRALLLGRCKSSIRDIGGRDCRSWGRGVLFHPVLSRTMLRRAIPALPRGVEDRRGENRRGGVERPPYFLSYHLVSSCTSVSAELPCR